MADNVTEAAIAMLERSIEEAETKIRALRSAINTMCTEAGLKPRYAEEQLVPGGARLAQIKDDTFYGMKQTPAMRDYLEMRKTLGQGPAKPREIFDALKSGGYQFESKDDEVALVGLRALLRTQPNVFHKLPQGTYGLTSWYPDAKRHSDEATLRKAKKGPAKRKKAKRARSAPEAAADNVVAMKAGGDKAA